MGKRLLVFLLIFSIIISSALAYQATDDNNCRKIIDKKTGFIKVKCQSSFDCPVLSDLDRNIISNKCTSLGMDLVVNSDHKGCETFSCGYSNANIFTNYDKCPSNIEIEGIVETCQEQNLLTYMERTGGCLVPVCRPVFINNTKKDSCVGNNGEYVEYIENGTVSYSECIQKASKENVKLDSVNSVPNIADLLQLTFKLESLKVEFEELYDKTNAISKYYRKIGDQKSADRFDKISLMFLNAKFEVDDIKTTIIEKTNSEKITETDILEIRYDINYLKEVMIKSILYEMLGTKEKKSNLDCNDNINCFENSFITCENNVTFTPNNFNIKIIGIQNDKCIIISQMNGETMECKVPKYYLGIQNPKTQILPYCDGNLVKTLLGENEEIL